LAAQWGQLIMARHGPKPLTLSGTKIGGRPLEHVRREKEEAIHDQQYDLAAELRDRELNLNQNLDLLEREWREGRVKENSQVTEEDIAEAVARLTDTPLCQIKLRLD
jgi:ATP-dependent Clp protease ATP-binding subunit ClpA